MRLRVLIVEDSAEDAALVLRHLKKGGYEPVHLVVSTGREMRKALRERSWEVILCDYSLPSFDAFAALKILKQSAVDLPFIVVSGSIDQDTAVATMKAGAHDYLLKDNLTRLVPAIRREIEEARVRQSRRIAESELAAVKEELALQLSDMTCLHQ
ncbi:MAG: response regulator, partial [Acidobacteria bacterium]|nr:response regulator [Acidobacteriota bacterium]